MSMFQRFSVRQKLIFSMVTSLLLCLAISTALGLYMTGQSTRERVVAVACLGSTLAQRQNAALVEQSTAAAPSLREQAERLMCEVAAFKLGDTHGNHAGHKKWFAIADEPALS